jgi:hypothetical protein
MYGGSQYLNDGQGVVSDGIKLNPPKIVYSNIVSNSDIPQERQANSKVNS